MFITVIFHSDTPFDSTGKTVNKDTAIKEINDSKNKLVYWGLSEDEDALRREIGRLLGVTFVDSTLSQALSNVKNERRFGVRSI